MNRRILLGVAIAGAITLAIAWSAEGRDAEVTQPPWITFSRSGCLGICPVFTLRVFANGRVEYDGKRFVIQRGRRRGQLSPRQLGRLRDVAARMAQFDAHCCDCRERTDHPGRASRSAIGVRPS